MFGSTAVCQWAPNGQGDSVVLQAGNEKVMRVRKNDLQVPSSFDNLQIGGWAEWRVVEKFILKIGRHFLETVLFGIDPTDQHIPGRRVRRHAHRAICREGSAGFDDAENHDEKRQRYERELDGRNSVIVVTKRAKGAKA